LPVLLARQFIGAATTALSLITGAFLPAVAAGNAQAEVSAPVCDAAGEIALLPSPWAPWKGAPLRVMFVTAPVPELSLLPPTTAVLPSADTATWPCAAFPEAPAPVPTSFCPCCVNCANAS
jgi:hypothetical protein